MSVKCADLLKMSEAEKRKLAHEDLFDLLDEAKDKILKIIQCELYTNPLVEKVDFGIITNLDVEKILSTEESYGPLVPPRTKEHEVL